MNWKQIMTVGLFSAGAVSLSGWISTPVVAMAGPIDPPKAASTPTVQVRQDNEKQDVEDRLKADFSHSSERYRRELQRGPIPNKNVFPESPQAERRRQAIEEIADPNGRAPAVQNPPTRKPQGLVPRFQFELAPLE